MKNIWKNWIQAPFFSSRGMLARAIALLIFYFILHLAGLREYTRFISGTSSVGGPSQLWINLAGITYFAAYSMALLLAPVFAMAAAILGAINLISPPESPSQQPPPDSWLDTAFSIILEFFVL